MAALTLTTLAPPPLALDTADVLRDGAVRGLYEALAGEWQNLDRVDRYLRGDHELRFATQKFTNAFGGLFRAFADNYCKRVVQTLSDYLQLDRVAVADPAAQERLDQWFAAQRIDAQGGRIHANAFGYGDGYAILAPDSANALRLYRQDVRSVRVLYDSECPDQLALALKVWRQADNSWRLNVYTDAFTYRFSSHPLIGNSGAGLFTDSSTGSGGTAGGGRCASPFVSGLPDGLRMFAPLQDGAVVANPVAMIPVFHFANEPDEQGQGVSELADIIPLQDGLNKSIVDMLVAMEFQSYRQRWMTGIEVQRDEDTGQPVQPPYKGPDRLWIAESPDAKFGEFAAIDLTQFLKVSESFRMEIARLARIPVHHLMMTDNFPSGEALKVAEQPLLAKIRDRQISWGNTWEDIARYVQAFQGAEQPASAYTAEWTDVSPRSAHQQAQGDLLEAQAAAAKVALGVSYPTVWGELGYTEEQQEAFIAPPAPPLPAAQIKTLPVKI